jgi:DNA-binding transcriptional regulator/RsmH inhibitor MraZ
MFFETHKVLTDKQGRISLPTGLFKSGSITRGGTLCVFPVQKYWVACGPERIEKLLETEYPGNSLDPEIRDLRREFMLTVKSVHIDLQGRIHVTGLNDRDEKENFVLVGMGFDFEIWPVKAWQECNEHSGGSSNE